ncbi:septation ring formation regulator EzrA [Pediococcus acidilactici]|jgi:septation ring formation regulator|uniref:septation ring formation regulator EzrA n=1 Tax=Pediococcus acidilactici TaxID=1254 RepID=UPI0006B651A1|nr:septation ring formation regulator EzrA [Pediococcus acidilactici]KAF0371121.1 septation ring formation regulator EzrA [Pediococcus acidilactici]KAF0382371.1 septation ring formation regulator EzrA [Pediococcus acidilactici]KAF0455889.1 septation ring formation regulator EzrA [Pediococcus acidilactici]KAF0475692.1 septation ring formation regulator EzrA [Pediococcus acidilactici]KAF0535801.1 septation ring formation regulator EzrA [Pediococcus acidilactici]
MIIVLISVIVVAILVYLGIVAYQRYLLKQVDELLNRKADISESPIRQKLMEVSSMNLTGSSAVGLDNIRNDYQEIIDHRLPEVEDIANHSRQNINDMKIFEARKDITTVSETLDAIEEETKRLNDQLDNIQRIDQEQRDAVKVLRMKYQEIGKQLLDQNLSLGPSIDLLEEKLSRLNDDFDTFNQTVDAGDHEKAEGQLKKLKASTSEIEAEIKAIPSLYDELTNLFPSQIEEVRDGYDQLINHNYAFENDTVKDEIKAIKAKINDNLETLSNLRLDAVRANNKAIEIRIDELYDILQTEIDARKSVEHNFNVITRFLDHAEKQNKVLLSEIARLDQSYVLNDDQLNLGQVLEGQLNDIRNEHDRDTERITNQPVVYSEIVERLKEENEQLTEIEDRQAALNSELQEMVDSEKDARTRLQQYDNEIHNIKRHVETLNLPGIPEGYMDYFFVVSDEIEKVGSDMNQVRINMGMINRELDMVSTDIQTLIKKTSDLTDDAAISEAAIQYANRYRHTDKEVAAASQQAQKLFDKDHRYNESLSVISKALDKVEPGAIENITENYYQQKKTEY